MSNFSEVNFHWSQNLSFFYKNSQQSTSSRLTINSQCYIMKEQNEQVQKKESIMPKIIKNLREQFLSETKKQLFSVGLSGITIRSIAQACRVGVGTVYNYFPSKEMLIGSCVFEDWKNYLAQIEALPKDDAFVLLGGIYEALRSFAKEYAPVFLSSGVAEEIPDFPQKHRMLRAQLAQQLLYLCERANMEDPVFGAEFIAENLISWSMEGVAFETVYPMLQKLIEVR